MKPQSILLWFAKWIFVACGIWLIGLGGYFMFLRAPLLPEDLRYLGLSTTQVEMLLPHLAPWLRNVFTVMGGFMAGCGPVVKERSPAPVTMATRMAGSSRRLGQARSSLIHLEKP